MTGEWARVPLEDLTEDDSPITYGVVKPGEESSDGVLLIRGGDIKHGQVELTNLRTITEALSEQYRRTILRGGELVVSLVGQPGEVAIVPHSLAGSNINRAVGLVRLRPDVNAAFVKYFLRSEVGRRSIVSLSLGSVQQVVNLCDLKRVLVPRPEPMVENAIAHILGTLDDKIELNRRMNETLKAMARALFKSWFVDFAPVRAKMASAWQRGEHLPGLPVYLYDLFPDHFEDSELGAIPAGWQVRPVGDVIERLSVGMRYEQRTAAPAGAVPVLDQGKTGVLGYHDHEPGVVASVERPVAVFANHTCYMRLIHFPFSTIQNVLPFVGNGVDTVWAFYGTYGKQPFLEYKGHWPDFVVHKIVVPSSELTAEYSRQVHPLLKRAWARDNESRTLAALRDTLLPNLISGELRVKEARGFMGRCA